MRALTFKPPAHYYVNAPRPFEATAAMSAEEVAKGFDFAYQMCFGPGHHRDVRTGGQAARRGGEKFCNTLQGKLAEAVLHQYFNAYDLPCHEIDYRIMGESAWDDSDLVVNGKYLSVKSAAFFANLLLLEQADWNDDGRYLPNMDNGSVCQYDFFILVRLKPDIKNLLRKNKLFYADKVERESLWDLVSSQAWYYDIPGYISGQELVENVIRTKQVLPQNAYLNGNIRMDASNYYVQAGDLNPIGGIVLEV